MFGVVDLPTYLVGLVVIVLLPGPNSLYVLSVATRSGGRPAFSAAAGVWTGDAILMTLAAAGVASLLQSNELLFSLVKYAGAGYLGWLGVGLLRAAVTTLLRRRVPSEAAVGEVEPGARPGVGAPMLSGPMAYRRALVISLLNPKAILFFISFFVQFVDPAYPHPWASFLFLGGLVEIASALYLAALIIGGVRLADLFRRRQSLTAGVTSVAGAAFIGFAVKLSLTSAS